MSAALKRSCNTLDIRSGTEKRSIDASLSVKSSAAALQYCIPSGDIIYAGYEGFLVNYQATTDHALIHIFLSTREDPDTVIRRWSLQPENTNPHIFSWNGQITGKSVDPGDYLLTFSVKNSTQEPIQIPVSVILLSTYFVDIPKEMEEAALIDGCSLFQLFFKVMLPLATSGIVAVSIYTFIQVWQEFLIASSFVRKSIHYTLTVGLSTFKGEFINWGGLMATSVIIAIPAMILFTVSQDFFINRLAGGVKE